MIKVEEVMNEEIITIEDNEQVSHARNLMLKYGYSHILVVNQEDKLTGIVTEKDITRKMRAKGPKWKRRPIDKISIHRVMTPNPLTISPHRELREAVELMIKNNISSIPIIDEGEIVGIITKEELIEFYSQKFSGKWKVSNLMTRNVITVNENHSIGHVIGIMEEKRISKIVVMRDQEPVGIITPANISFADVDDLETGVEKIYFLRPVEGKSKRNVREVSLLTAGDIMMNDLVKIHQDEDAANAANIMVKNNISGVPVVENDELVGIITRTDLIRGIQ